jgi:hypothetical protein
MAPGIYESHPGGVITHEFREVLDTCGVPPLRFASNSFYGWQFSGGDEVHLCALVRHLPNDWKDDASDAGAAGDEET